MALTSNLHVRTILWSAGLIACCTLVTASVASSAPNTTSYPEHPVRMIVGFPAGGGTDIVARIFAEKLAAYWNQPVIVDNRAGAGGVIGTEAAARAAPDGYTIFMGTMGNLSVNQHLYSMNIDPVTAFEPVAQAVAVDFVLVANPSVPVENVKQLISLARQKPGELNYSSSGVGGAPHLAGELFCNVAGVDMVHVPYKGSGPSFTDLLGGQVSVTFDSLVQALPYIKNGDLRSLAVLGNQRSPLLPDVPTMQEAGLEGYNVTNWFGVTVPAGTPRAIVEEINDAIRQVQRDTTVSQKLAQMGATVTPGTPEEFERLIKEDSAKWAKIIEQANIKQN